MKNYHTHTKRCHHAIDNEEDYIQAAIASGYTELGFSDHSPWMYQSSFHPTMRMEAYEIGDYVSTLLKLKEKYKNQISIKIGLECEYFEKYMDGLKEMLKTYPIDYILGAGRLVLLLGRFQLLFVLVELLAGLGKLHVGVELLLGKAAQCTGEGAHELGHIVHGLDGIFQRAVDHLQALLQLQLVRQIRSAAALRTGLGVHPLLQLL